MNALKKLPKHICSALAGSGKSIHNINKICQIRFLTSTTSIVQQNNEIPNSEFDSCVKLSRFYEKTSVGLYQLQRKFSDEIQQPSPKIKEEDLRELIFLSATDKDFDLVLKVLKLYAELNNINYGAKIDMKSNLPFNVMKLLYFYKKTNKVIEYFNDKNFGRLFRGYRTIDMYFRHLFDEKRYKDLNLSFQAYFRNYIKFNNSGNENNNQTSQQKWLSVPNSHIYIVTKSYLLQNDSVSLDQFKTFINKFQQYNHAIPNVVMLRMVLLALNHDHAQYASDILACRIFDQDETLSKNLKLMAFSRSGRLNDVVRFLKNMISRDNKLYPYAFKVLREDLEKNINSADLNNNQSDVCEQIDILLRRAKIEDRIETNQEDLMEMALNDRFDDFYLNNGINSNINNENNFEQAKTSDNYNSLRQNNYKNKNDVNANTNSRNNGTINNNQEKQNSFQNNGDMRKRNLN